MPLGIILKNEAKTEDMVDILSHISDYIPTVESSKEVTLSNGEKVKEDQSVMHNILLGGDQMTAARVRAAQDAKDNAQTAYQRFEGFVPVLEDWHTKANFMGVSVENISHEYSKFV